MSHQRLRTKYGNIVDLLSLIQPDKETIDKSRQIHMKTQGKKIKQWPGTFGNWLQGFFFYASFLCECFPEMDTSLFCSLNLIWDAYKVYRGPCWYNYDIQ